MTANGVTYRSVREAARAHGLTYRCVDYRLRAGWTSEQALGLVDHPHSVTKNILLKGKVFKNLAEACKHFQKPYDKVKRRRWTGWPIEQALELVPRPPRKPARGNPIEVGGQRFPSITAAATAYGLDPGIVAQRLDPYGWSKDEAFELVPRRRKRPLRDSEVIDRKVYPKGNFGEYKLYLITNTVNRKEYVGITLGTAKAFWRTRKPIGVRRKRQIKAGNEEIRP